MTEDAIRSQPFSLTRADYTAHYIWAYRRAFTTFPTAIWMWFAVLAPYAGLTFGDLEAGRYVNASLILLVVATVWFGIVSGLGLMSLLGTLSRTHHAYQNHSLKSSAPISGVGKTRRAMKKPAMGVPGNRCDKTDFIARKWVPAVNISSIIPIKRGAGSAMASFIW